MSDYVVKYKCGSCRNYEYEGKEKVNFKGMKKSQYIFKGITTDFQKPFDVSATLRIRKVTGRQDEVKFEIY